VAEKLGIDLVWFGVLLAINMQTSFMHPPFGFALFYLRSVAAQSDYDDKITGRRIAKVTTGQIYWGAVPFVIIQVVMVGLVIAFPALVSSGLVEGTDGRRRQGVPQMQMRQDARQRRRRRLAAGGARRSAPPAARRAALRRTTMRAIIESMQREKDAKKP
jgi:hypothetical protein